MPVILEPGSDAIRRWLDPNAHEWSRDLQSLLQPFAGEVEVYPVNKDVGKVGNNSPSFIRPLYSKENKSNIANFFSSPRSDERVKNVAEQPQSKDKVKVATPTVSIGKRKEPPVETLDSPKKRLAGEKISSTRNAGRKTVTTSKGAQKITNFFSI